MKKSTGLTKKLKGLVQQTFTIKNIISGILGCIGAPAGIIGIFSFAFKYERFNNPNNCFFLEKILTTSVLCFVGIVLINIKWKHVFAGIKRLLRKIFIEQDL